MDVHSLRFSKDVAKKGRIRAKARGVLFGRKPKLTHYQRQEVLSRLAGGETQADIARSYAVDRSMISRLAATASHGAECNNAALT